MLNRLDAVDLTIPSGGSNTNAIQVPPHILGLILIAPEALTGVVTVAISLDEGSSFQTLQEGGADLAIGAGEAIIISPFGADEVRLESAGTEGADRDFLAQWIEELT